MLDTRAIKSAIKTAIKRPILRVLTFEGRYEPFTAAERRCELKEAVSFVGDLPPNGGDELFHHRLEFAVKREPVEVDNLLYTPAGMGWVDGVLLQRYSVREPPVRELLYKPTPRATIAQGTVVQAQHPNTYGDWVSEHVMTLVTASRIQPPLLMPKRLMDKSYVRRDLDLLGIEAVTVEKPLLVRRATVLPKGRPNHHWAPEEAAAFRQAFRVKPVPPRPGSILYLSRAGEESEYPRYYPSEFTADVIRRIGGRVVLARDTSLEQYRSLGHEAETVIADHGSAICNLLFWNTRNLIELFTDRWWNECFLFLGRAVGVQNHAMVRIDNISNDELARRIFFHLRNFEVLTSPHPVSVQEPQPASGSR